MNSGGILENLNFDFVILFQISNLKIVFQKFYRNYLSLFKSLIVNKVY